MKNIHTCDNAGTNHTCGELSCDNYSCKAGGREGGEMLSVHVNYERLGPTLLSANINQHFCTILWMNFFGRLQNRNKFISET